MNEKLLKILKKVVVNVAGQNADKIVDMLYKKANVNEFHIAKKLGGTINQTRNLLYKLLDHGLVEFNRKKDKKKGGWYTYYWTLKTKRVLQLNKEELEKKIKEFQTELQTRQNARYFVCPNCGTEFNEENAIISDFTCSECGEVLQLKDINSMTEEIKREIEKNHSLLKEINKEIEEIELKEQKNVARKMKAEIKKKEALRKKLRMQKQAAKTKQKIKNKKIKRPQKKKVKKKKRK